MYIFVYSEFNTLLSSVISSNLFNHLKQNKMKKVEINAVDKAFSEVKDYQLQRFVVIEWKQERSISGLTRYIVKNFDNSLALKELLTRKGYRKSNFGTAAQPNFSFVLSHMSDKAKYRQTRVKALNESEKDILVIKTDETGAKVAKVTYQLGSVLNELRNVVI